MHVFYKGELVTVFEDLGSTECGEITCVLVSDDVRMVFARDTTLIIIVWRLKTEPRKDEKRPLDASLALMNTLYGHHDEITCLVHSKKYKVIANGSEDDSLLICDLNSLMSVRHVGGQDISCVSISRSIADIIAASGVDVSVWTKFIKKKCIKFSCKWFI